MENVATQHTNGAGAVAVGAAEKQRVDATLKAAAFGEIMSVLLQSPRHRHVTLAVLAKQMLPAFLTNQFVLARAKPDNSDAPPTPVGTVFWASVSDDVDRRLTADLTKPIELAAEEWQSGDTIWLIDIVAAPQVHSALVKNVREKVGPGKTIKLRMVGADGQAVVRAIN